MRMTEPAAALADRALKAFFIQKYTRLQRQKNVLNRDSRSNSGRRGSSLARPISGDVSEQVFHPGPERGQAPRGCTWWNVPIVASDSHANATTLDYVRTKISTVTIATAGPVTSPIRDIRKSALPSLSPDQDRSSKMLTSALLHARMRSLVRAKAP
jgi:hypothetical protein